MTGIDRSAIRLRGRNTSVNRTTWAWVGVATGVVSALLPTGYFDARGAGAIGGVIFALYGVTAAAPVVLTALVCAEVAGDYERGMCRDMYLSGGSRSALHAGALLSAVWSWVVFCGAALIAGVLVGLGDGMRHSAPWGWTEVALERPIACLALHVYVAALAGLTSWVCRRALPSVLILFGTLVAGVVLVPAANAADWGWALRLLPYSPLIGLF